MEKMIDVHKNICMIVNCKKTKPKFYKLKFDEFMSKKNLNPYRRRKQEIIYKNAWTVFLKNNYPMLTLGDIAQMSYAKDHSTIISRLKKDKDFTEINDIDYLNGKKELYQFLYKFKIEYES